MFSILRQKFFDWQNKIKNYNKIANISSNLRRYFATSGFDGIITMLGVLAGNYVVKVNDFKHIIVMSFAICISLGVSGVWGVYFFESAERKKEIDDLENSTLHNLDHTIIYYALRYASRISAAVNGFSAVITALIPIIPFFFGKYLPINVCYLLAFVISLLVLFAIGLFLGKISKTRLIVSGIKMLLAGVFCVILSLVLDFIS
ncbi:VIT1/CCC1 transporter family protein [bacterium]|nr:VIT1/CCC1 transporter family protein [bacterium]